MITNGRQEIVAQENYDQAPALSPPFLTLCPIFNDWMLQPAAGFENRELTFEKYTLLQERNFLAINFSYKGYFLPFVFTCSESQ